MVVLSALGMAGIDWRTASLSEPAASTTTTKVSTEKDRA
jgi:hypothetical protein